MEEWHVPVCPGLVSPGSSGVNLWHFRCTLYDGGLTISLWLERVPRCVLAPLHYDVASITREVVSCKWE